MSLRQALLERDLEYLPGKRQEEWRWTDLKGPIRTIPKLTDETQPLVDKPWLDALEGVTVRRVAAPMQAGVQDADLVVAKGERLVLIDTFEKGRGVYLRDLALALTLDEGAVVERLILAEDSADAVTVANLTVTLGAGSTYRQTVLSTGARRQRVETTVQHPGAGANVRLDGAYMISDARHADQTTRLLHEGPHGESRQLVRGVAGGTSNGVFQGRIVVARGADGTDARLAHNALMLSDRAEIDSKPELEIYADDGVCAHGNTVGALDEQALFYATARGIPERQARLMLIEAFLSEIALRIEHEGLREIASTFIRNGLKEVS